MIYLLIIFMTPILIFSCVKIIGLHKSQMQHLQDLYLAYQTALEEYKQNQHDTDKRERCLNLGREYYSKALPGPYGDRLQNLYTQLDLSKEFILFQNQLVLKDLTLEVSSLEQQSKENFPTIPLVS